MDCHLPLRTSAALIRIPARFTAHGAFSQGVERPEANHHRTQMQPSASKTAISNLIKPRHIWFLVCGYRDSLSVRYDAPSIKMPLCESYLSIIAAPLVKRRVICVSDIT